MEELHKVVLYVRRSSRQFTTTARKQTSSLPRVDKQMSDKGYLKFLIADGIESSEAKRLKSRINLACEAMGYEYTERETFGSRKA